MKPRYEEFTPEEIEDLDNECARMAQEISDLQDRNAELVDVLRKLRSHAKEAFADAPNNEYQKWFWVCKTIDQALA